MGVVCNYSGYKLRTGSQTTTCRRGYQDWWDLTLRLLIGDREFEFSMGSDDFQAVVCTALAAAGRHMYIVENSRVQVFE